MSFEDDYYECYECGARMELVDDEVLVCPNCNHSIDLEDYVTEEEDLEDIRLEQQANFCEETMDDDF